MSCIAGIINLDGGPVDRELLLRMTGVMVPRAPDAIETWCAGNVGFGHSMLRIVPEAESERQPCTLDGKVWITADARIDGRTELLHALRSEGQDVRPGAADVELILHAYSAFGENFLNYLIGDFAFALWDEHNKRLFCARDQFGVRPFFYSHINNTIFFASDINALLACKKIPSFFDEEFIIEFLLFGCSIQPASSVYRYIRRIQPATCLQVNMGKVSISQYWELKTPGELRYSNPVEYSERFKDIFRLAVKDRSRTSKISMELSGGLDSSSIAAFVEEDFRFNRSGLTSFTVVDSSFGANDEDKRHAATVASFLGIEQIQIEMSKYDLFERLDSFSLRTTEPPVSPLVAINYDKMARAAAGGAKLMITGQGGDESLAGSSDYYINLFRTGNYAKFLYKLAIQFWTVGSLRSTGLQSILFGDSFRPNWRPVFPDWLDSGFGSRNNAKDRWDLFWNLWNGKGEILHPLKRPWLSQSTFPNYEVFALPIVGVHPYFDLRLIELLLEIPGPMLKNKKIVRESLDGRLPEVVLQRNKSGGIFFDNIKQKYISNKCSKNELICDAAEIYIDRERFASRFNEYKRSNTDGSTWASWLISMPLLLDGWLLNN